MQHLALASRLVGERVADVVVHVGEAGRECERVVVHLDGTVQLLVGEVELAWLGLGLGLGLGSGLGLGLGLGFGLGLGPGLGLNLEFYPGSSSRRPRSAAALSPRG